VDRVPDARGGAVVLGGGCTRLLSVSKPYTP
jgi:hypothetical protein